MRCKHGPADGQVGGGGGAPPGRGEGGAPPRAKRAKLEPVESMSADDLRTELKRRGVDAEGQMTELASRLEEDRRGDASEQEEGEWCSWRGRVCELAGHLAESCAYEPVQCSVAGCNKLVPRKDAARHTETCEYRTVNHTLKTLHPLPCILHPAT